MESVTQCPEQASGRCSKGTGGNACHDKMSNNQKTAMNIQGAITISSIMMECAASQDGYQREVFLLSELERVWDAVSLCIRHYLAEGRNVRVCNFGSFWFETRAVATDGIERYYVRRIRFGVDNNFALRYNIDSIRVQQEPHKLQYVKVNIADVVDIAKVPAHTASIALREFFSYVGEGIFKKRLFKIHFPGVATLIIKSEKAVLEVERDLRSHIFAVDSRKWPLSIREVAEPVVLGEDQRPNTASSSGRPASGQGGVKRFNCNSKPIEPRPAFMPVAPRNRLFAEIEKDPPRKLPVRGAVQGHIDNRLHIQQQHPCEVKESIFNALDPEEIEQASMEPEIEGVEEIRETLPPLQAYEEEAPRCAVGSVRHSYHDHSSVRDLLYGNTAQHNDPMLCGRRRYIKRDIDQVAALMKESQEAV